MQLKPAESGSAGFGKGKAKLCSCRTARSRALREDELAAGKGHPQAPHGAGERERRTRPDQIVEGRISGGLGIEGWQVQIKSVDEHDATALQRIGQGGIEQGQPAGQIGGQSA